MNTAALKSLRRVELILLSSPVPEVALQVSDLILRYQGVVVEAPTPVHEILKLCEELELDEPHDEHAQLVQDVTGGKNLLIEVVKRVSFDWVLYRSSRKTDLRKLAEEAYIWLFLEDESHHHRQVRNEEGKSLTSFFAICEVLDMDMDRIRAKIRTLTPQRVMSSGRPPGHARNDVYDGNISVHAELPSEEPEVEIGSFF